MVLPPFKLMFLPWCHYPLEESKNYQLGVVSNGMIFITNLIEIHPVFITQNKQTHLTSTCFFLFMHIMKMLTNGSWITNNMHYPGSYSTSQTNLAQNKDKCPTVVNTVLTLHVPVLSSYVTMDTVRESSSLGDSFKTVLKYTVRFGSPVTPYFKVHFTPLFYIFSRSDLLLLP
jgi:hypothetical protein